MSVELAPDAKRAATVLLGESGDGQIWIVDLVRGVRTRLARAVWQLESPVWSADGSRVLFTSQEHGALDLFLRFSDGSGESEPVFVNELDKVLMDWSRDGKYVAYWPLGPGSGTGDIWIYSLESGKTEPLVAGEAFFSNAQFSPDSRWISYASDDSGDVEVYVQAFGGDDGVRGGARWQLSTAGGDNPRWRDDGREIVYLDPDRRMMAVSVEEQGGRLVLGTPHELFVIHDTVIDWDATGDHKRFLVATRDEIPSEPLHVVLNWPADLE